MRGQKLTCTFYVDGKQVDKLTPEQCERMAQKVGEVMSIYYTAHQDEYRQLSNGGQSRTPVPTRK
jgi:hypothetical protein